MDKWNEKSIGTWALYGAIIFSIFFLITNSIFTGAQDVVVEKEKYAAKGAWANQWIAVITLIGVALNGFIAYFVARTFRFTQAHGEMEIRGYPIVAVASIEKISQFEFEINIIIENAGKTAVRRGFFRVRKANIPDTINIGLPEPSMNWFAGSGGQFSHKQFVRCFPMHPTHRTAVIEFEYSFSTIFKKRFVVIDTLEMKFDNEFEIKSYVLHHGDEKRCY